MKSAMPDSKLPLYQLFCRYSILHGMGLPEATELWNSKFKRQKLSREELLTRLNERFITSNLPVQNTAAEE